jgi:hypothetical protein
MVMISFLAAGISLALLPSCRVCSGAAMRTMAFRIARRRLMEKGAAPTEHQHRSAHVFLRLFKYESVYGAVLRRVVSYHHYYQRTGSSTLSF